jgi:exosome complex component RRP43
MTRLPLTKKPVSMSFGLFNSYEWLFHVDPLSLTSCLHSNKSCVLADPTSFEEPLLDTTVTIVVGDDNELLSVSQVGLGSASQDILSVCITAAKRRHSSLGRQVYG